MLGDIAKLQRGVSITRKSIEEGSIPVIAGGQQPAYFHNESNREDETIVIAGSGAGAGSVSYWNQPIFVSDAFSIKPNNKILLTKFTFYFLKNHENYLRSLKRGGGVPHVYAKDVAPFRVPIPPLEVQRELVAILDKFDALVNDLSSGLPAEIQARRRQYEYYRDRLLSFQEAVQTGEGMAPS